MDKSHVSYPVICSRITRLWNSGVTSFVRIASIVGQSVTAKDVELFVSGRPGYPGPLKPNDKPKDGTKKRRIRMKLDDRIGLSVRQTMASRKGSVSLPTLPGPWNSD